MYCKLEKVTISSSKTQFLITEFIYFFDNSNIFSFYHCSSPMVTSVFGFSNYTPLETPVQSRQLTHQDSLSNATSHHAVIKLRKRITHSQKWNQNKWIFKNKFYKIKKLLNQLRLLCHVIIKYLVLRWLTLLFLEGVNLR